MEHLYVTFFGVKKSGKQDEVRFEHRQDGARRNGNN